jgi:hypothetical protein
MVGYGCYITGTPTKAVQKVSSFIDNEKIDEIIVLLDSKNAAEKYLAVIVLEKLDEKTKFN